jgi:hypothetical protein
MAEARNAPRAVTKQHGLAIVSGRSEIDCSIRDLSATGARLRFTNPTFLPRTFTLRLEDQDHKVTVMWQAGLMAGVRFQTPLRNLAAQKKKRWPWSKS